MLHVRERELTDAVLTEDYVAEFLGLITFLQVKVANEMRYVVVNAVNY